MRQFTQHFHQVEFLSRDGAPMPAGKAAELLQLCDELLEPGRKEFGRCAIVSGHRSDAHNRAVGGALDSYHLHRPGRRGAAADLIFARGDPRAWWNFYNRLGAGGVGRYSSFVHVDNRLRPARW